MTREEFRAWRTHPATELFMGMIEAQIEKAKEAWVKGEIADPAVQAKAGNMRWVVGLEWKDLNEFYQWELEDADGPEAADSE